MANSFLMALVLVAIPVQASEADPTALESPLERQVFQRNADEKAQVALAGPAPAGTTLVEAKADLGPALRGKAVDWTAVAQGDQIKEGRFRGTLALETGGWYSLTVRFRKSADTPSALAQMTVKEVGVGDVFITAGQSNSVNHGHPRQKSSESLSMYFDGKSFVPAADPIPGGAGAGGTPWPLLGDMLSRTTRAPVCFRSATLNYLRVREWVPGAKSGNIERLVERAQWFGPEGVRAVLWVQGEADAGRPDFTPADQYERDGKAMVAFSREKLGWSIDWFMSGTSYCPPRGPQDWKEGIASVLKGQKALWDAGVVLRGPDTNDLVGNSDYRHDTIHFGPRALQVVAERWYATLVSHYGWLNPVTRTMK